MNPLLRFCCHGLVAFSAVFTATSSFAAKVQYDLTRDFSTNRNPNGVWSFNYNAAPITTFQTFWWGGAGWGNNSLGDGAILKGGQPTGTDPWGNPIQPPHDWQSDDVMLHALSIPYGGESTFLNVTWTSPADGTIDIAGRAWEGEIFADRDVGWTLLVGGRIVAQRMSVQDLYRTDRAADFAANLLPQQSLTDIRVTRGEAVEFRVVTKTYYGHFVGLQLNITHTSQRLPPNVRAGKFTFDLTRDWSNTQNPHGPWSYNYNQSPISTYQTFWWNQAGWGDNWLGDGGILKGNPPTGTDPWGNPILPPHDWQPGDVMMHALSVPYGGESTFLNVTWTSPADGIMDISGRAWEGEIFDDHDVAWELKVRDQIVAQRESTRSLYRTDAGAAFSANLVGTNTLSHIRVAQGDVVEFRVLTKTYYGHFVGVNATIVLRARGLPLADHVATRQQLTPIVSPVQAIR